jgi:ubiquinone/menaquinone biosynthesis C-methylase UbiE
VSCCGALQLFPQAIGEISRVLKPGGEFVCQTTIGPRKAPFAVRAADRVLKFSWFYLDDLKDRLSSFNFNVITEERSYINYIFLRRRQDRLMPQLPSSAEEGWLREVRMPRSDHSRADGVVLVRNHASFDQHHPVRSIKVAPPFSF